jgi:hypothetical protein
MTSRGDDPSTLPVEPGLGIERLFAQNEEIAIPHPAKSASPPD